MKTTKRNRPGARRALGGFALASLAMAAMAPVRVLAQAATPPPTLLASTRGDATADEPARHAAAASHLPADGLHSGAYELPFGSNVYFPSQAKTAFQGFLKPEQIPSAAYCEHCHQGTYAQWRQSAHANSFRAPWYKKNVQDLMDTRGVPYARHCEGCHNPAAMVTGAMTTGSTVERPHDEDGVTCMVCHSLRQEGSTGGIGSYVMGVPAVMLNEDGTPRAGLPSDAEILEHLEQHRKAVMQPFYHTSEYCAACHKAAMPAMLNGYKWLRTFSTYDEWQQSSWSTETPLPFYNKPAAFTCQSCHMGRETTAGAPGGGAKSHRWLGANTAVPAQYHFDEQAKKVVAFLKADALQVDIFGITVEHDVSHDPKATTDSTKFVPGALIAPLGLHAFRFTPGEWVRVDVVVRNKGIGHMLVPELRDFYESWLEFEATDDSGQTLYHSGAVDPATHQVDPEAHAYTTRILSSDGKALNHHEVWKIYTRAYDATIGPGRSEVVRYRFRVPGGSKGFKIAASVRYRRFRRAFWDYATDEKPEAEDRFPIVTMASGSFHVASGTNEPLPAGTFPDDQNEMLRWNNYGIGMIDRQQYTEAYDAFSHVLRVNPRYERGYVNVGIAEYMRGRYPESIGWLERALRLDATDARAMYYKGLCLRWQTRYDEAVAQLEPVAERYPRFRQVHQELGYIYMLQRRFADSKKEYDVVLGIDPDDALAHRWLGPVLAALGDKAGAAREAILAAQYNPDPDAGWVAQRYWRENLTIAHQAIPAHTYSDGDKADDADVQRMLNLQNPPSYIWVENY